MTRYDHSEQGAADFQPEDFNIRNLDDEIRADQLCHQLLEHFYLDQVNAQGATAEEASALAYGADYFLREFVIGDRRENILAIHAERIRQFAGNWYIVKTLEPNLAELEGVLRGVSAFYAYCARIGKIPTVRAAEIRRAGEDRAYFQERIESFWSLEGNGYVQWEAECSLSNDRKEPQEQGP